MVEILGINTFSDEVREQVLEEQNWQCGLYTVNEWCTRELHSVHHIIENTIPHRHKYGNKRIQSRENAIGLCYECHTNYRHLLNEEAWDLLSKWDKELKKEQP